MVQVRVSEGVLEGQVEENEFGGTYCSFRGVPYAEPPLGDLRFKAPQPLKAWDGIRSAKEFGPVCPQFDVFVKSVQPGSEDCLYLNVYTPELTPKAPLPVMFWIHGGGLIWGSGNDDMYGPEFLVRQGVILVTINYRLEVLGFLCLDTKDVPGNAGMKDQVAALKWVKNNISNFGGDPDNITIFGESAGGISVNYHLLSPMSKGLFKRAICQSGVADTWPRAFEPREKANALARKLGLDSEDDKEIYDFLKSQPTESFIGVQAPLTFSEAAKFGSSNFAIVSEKKFNDAERFFYEDLDTIHEGIEVMAGYVEDEGLFIVGMFGADNNIAQANNYLEYFVPIPISLKYPIKEQLNVGKKIKRFYYKNEQVSKDNCEPLLRFNTANFFSYPTIRFLKKCARTNQNKLYSYKFTCKSERNVFKYIMNIDNNLTGGKQVVCHCDDLAYLFPIKLRPQQIDQDSREFKMIDRVTRLWTNFAKFGNPTPDDSLGSNWNPYTLEGQDYLDIGDELVSSTAPEKEEVEFWDNIYKEYNRT